MKEKEPTTLEQEETFPESIHHEVFTVNWKAYSETPNEYKKLLINHFNQEVQTLKDYEGRELYELIQNVEDAGSSEIRIELHGNRLVIANDGNRPFSVAGYGAILRPFQSNKRKQWYIGNKGLGFRSVLNWTRSLSVCSLTHPGSSAGIRCNFSEEIAFRKYKELFGLWKANGLTPRAERMLEIEAKNYGRQYPIAILSVPDVEEWMPREGITTQIEMELTEEVIEKVKGNIEALKDSLFFLFLRNLKTIIIDIDGNITTIECVKREKIIELHIRTGEEETVRQRWMIERIEDDRNSVAAARRIDVSADELDKHEYYFHSFFPTLIKLGFGCALHANVELNSSRNYVVTTDESLFELLADTVRRLADEIKAYHKDDPTWDAYDIFVEKNSGWSKDRHFERFIEGMKHFRETEALAPTVSGEYLPLAETVALTEDFSEFALSAGAYSEAFDNVVRPGFSSVDVYGNTDFSLNAKMLQKFADTPMMPVDVRAEFIALLQKAFPKDGLPEDGTLHLFTDKEGNHIRQKAWLLTADQRQIPSILKVQLVDDELTGLLKIKLADPLRRLKEEEEREGKQSNDERRLHALLYRLSDLGYTDFSYLKTKLFAASSQRHSMEQDVEMVKYLYIHYKDNRKRLEKEEDEILTRDSILYINDKGGKLRPICNLLYGAESGPWAPMVANWSSLMDLPPEEEESVRDFLVERLHMGRKVPMTLDEWVLDDKYLATVAGGRNHWHYAQKAVRDKLKEEGLSAFAFIVDKPFVENTSPGNLLRDFLEDDNAYNAIMNGERDGDFTVWYVKSSAMIPYVDYYAKTPASVFLREKLKGLSNYMLDTASWVGEPMIDVGLLSREQKERLAKIARLFGAKGDDSELSIPEIYDAIANATGKNHRSVYQQMKRLLKEKEERGEAPDTVPDLQVWASLGGTLLPDKISNKECYYADNTPPKAIYEKFPILDIGRREGVEQVSRYFGIKPVSEIFTIPVTEASRHLELMEDKLKDLLERRAVYILAARCESFRYEKLETSAKEAFAQLKGIVFSVWDNLQFKLEIEGWVSEEIFNLENGQFLKYKGEPSDDKPRTDWEYFLATENSNTGANREVVSAVASMLCSQYKLQETVWGERFYTLLRLPDEDLEYKLFRDYPEEYVDLIKDVVAEKKDIELRSPRIWDKNDFEGLVKDIVTNAKERIYLECLSSGNEQQKEFLARCDRKEIELEEKIDRFLASLPLNTDKMEAERILRKQFKEYLIPTEITSEIKRLTEYEDWLSENIPLLIFELNQIYPDIHSLTFFPGNLEIIKNLWEEYKKRETEDKMRLKDQETNWTPTELEICSGSKVEKPETRSGDKQGRSKHGKPKGAVEKEAQSVYGGNAEKDVVAFLKAKGWKVWKSSSNLDDTLTDRYHYDLSAEDENGVTRFIDVKYTSDGLVHVSEAQYMFASRMKKARHPYELYVVYDGRLHILTDIASTLDLYGTPESYRIRVLPPDPTTDELL